jgi:Na+/melibiose symporter-like transporter
MTAFPFRRRLGFALGDTGFNFVWQSIELYLLFFYTKVLHLPIGWAAAIFFVGAVVDWISDPVIGALADRTAARSGRMRTWLVGSAPVLGLCLVLAFSKPDLPPGPLFWWALGAHLLLRIAYSAGNIPYAALTARITVDAGEQARLTGLRMQCAAIGGLTVAAVYWNVPGIAGGGDARRFLVGAALLGLLVQPFLLIAWRSAVELPGQRGVTPSFSYRRELAALVRLVRESGAVIQLLLVIVLAGLTTSLMGKSILFLFATDLGRADLGYPATLIPALALLLATPFWLFVRDRAGPHATLALAAIVHGGSALALAGAVAAGAPAPLSVALLAVAITGTTGLSVIFWAMAATVAGAATEGCHARVFALATTARKLAQALASPSLAFGLWVSGATGVDGRVAPVLAIVALACTSGILLLAAPDIRRTRPAPRGA